MSHRDGIAGPREGVITGPARIDASVKSLVRRLQPGDIAVIDALDLDRASAEALAACRPAAVLNVQPSISGRYPTGGASVLADAGVPLVDRVDASILSLREGSFAEVDLRGGDGRDGAGSAAGTEPEGDDATGPGRARIELAAREFEGIVMDRLAIADALTDARAGLQTQLSVFTASAMDVVERSGGALLRGEGLPAEGIDLHDKHVVVIAPGYDVSGALRSIRAYLRDHKPIVIAVGEAAELARKAGCQPHVIVGSTEAVSEATLSKARHVIAHTGTGAADADERRLGELQRDHASSDLAVASEDLAILVAAHGGAKAIVTVGIDADLTELLESGRPDAAGTFLARLNVGSRLVDARTLGTVYRPRWTGASIAVAVVLAVTALAAALWANAESRTWIEGVLGAAGAAS